MSFASDIARFGRKAIDRNFADLKQNVGIALFSAVINASPVGNPDLWKSQQGKGMKSRTGPVGYVGGRFRANWNCHVGSANRTTTENVDPTGSIAIANVVSECSGATASQSLFLTNSLPYSIKLEYEGHSSQAPQGMVRLNVARFRKIIKKELAKYR